MQKLRGAKDQGELAISWLKAGENTGILRSTKEEYQMPYQNSVLVGIR